jgi:hypothetical protein
LEIFDEIQLLMDHQRHRLLGMSLIVMIGDFIDKFSLISVLK